MALGPVVRDRRAAGSHVRARRDIVLAGRGRGAPGASPRRAGGVVAHRDGARRRARRSRCGGGNLAWTTHRPRLYGSGNGRVHGGARAHGVVGDGARAQDVARPDVRSPRGRRGLRLQVRARAGIAVEVRPRSRLRGGRGDDPRDRPRTRALAPARPECHDVRHDQRRPVSMRGHRGRGHARACRPLSGRPASHDHHPVPAAHRLPERAV